MWRGVGRGHGEPVSWKWRRGETARLQWGRGTPSAGTLGLKVENGEKLIPLGNPGLAQMPWLISRPWWGSHNSPISPFEPVSFLHQFLTHWLTPKAQNSLLAGDLTCSTPPALMAPILCFFPTTKEQLISSILDPRPTTFKLHQETQLLPGVPAGPDNYGHAIST